MKKSLFSRSSAAAWLLGISALIMGFQLQDEPGFLYATAFERICGGESLVGWTHVVVGRKEYPARMKELKESMKKQYPNAEVRVASSFMSYGKNVKYIYAIKWHSGRKNCPNVAWTVAFGKNQAEAEQSVLKVKSNSSAPNASHSVLASEFIPAILSPQND